MSELRIVLLAAIGLVALLAALLHGGVWEKNNPEKLGFKWGYFVVYNTLINNMLIFGFFTWVGIEEKVPSALLLGVLALAVSIGIAYFSIRRQRWALIISTVLTLNPLWMLINIFYLKNRWPEFRAESSTKAGNHLRESSTESGTHLSESSTVTGITATERIKSLPRDIRAALFVIIAWTVCVPSFVFLFQPYGRYMRDDDIAHMLGVILVPVTIGFGLFLLYRKFVK